MTAGKECVLPLVFQRRRLGFDEVMTPDTQVHVHEALALGVCLLLLYELLRYRAFRKEMHSVPHTGVRHDRPARQHGQL